MTSAGGEEIYFARVLSQDHEVAEVAGRASAAGLANYALRGEEQRDEPSRARTDFERKANRKLWTPRKVFFVEKISPASTNDAERTGYTSPAGLSQKARPQLTSVSDVRGRRDSAEGRASSSTVRHRSVEGVETTRSTTEKIAIYGIQHVIAACRFRERKVAQPSPSQTGPDTQQVCSSSLQREPACRGRDDNEVEAADEITSPSLGRSAPCSPAASTKSRSDPNGECALMDHSGSSRTVDITDCKFVPLTRTQWDFFFSCLMRAAHRTEKHEKGVSQPTAQADHCGEPNFDVMGKKNMIRKGQDRNGKMKDHVLPESLAACVKLVELDVLDVDHDLLKDYATASTRFADELKNNSAAAGGCDGDAVEDQNEIFPGVSPAMSTSYGSTAGEELQVSNLQLQPDAGVAVHPTKTAENLPQFTFVDLFAGIGGFSCGLKSGNFCHLRGTCLLASECDAEARYLYEVNHGKPLFGFNTDITTLEKLPACPLTGQLDLLCAGFPCQSFSKANSSRKGLKNELANPGQLFFEIVRLLKHSKSLKPRALLLENVPGLLELEDGKVFETVKQLLEQDCGYEVHHKVLNSHAVCPDVVPQNRDRLYIVGFLMRRGGGMASPSCERTEPEARLELDQNISPEFDFHWPEPPQERQHIDGGEKHVPSCSHSDMRVDTSSTRTSCGDQDWRRAANSKSHNAGTENQSDLSPPMEKTSLSSNSPASLRQIRPVTVRDILEPDTALEQNPEKLKSVLLTDTQWEKVKSHRSWTSSKKPKKRIVELDYLARTLTARYKSGYLVQSEFVPYPRDEDGTHENESVENLPPPRFFTLRECARLQGFPETFCVENQRNANRFYYQCGNAVCPPLVAKIARNVLECLGVGIITATTDHIITSRRTTKADVAVEVDASPSTDCLQNSDRKTSASIMVEEEEDDIAAGAASVLSDSPTKRLRVDLGKNSSLVSSTALPCSAVGGA
ncbi:unnamed protein product [Amoebophrya sp. A120]|nr:unnamed protein product [Amoebophrya sp. A120]|eukprot:GSA120T00016242001.1